MNNEIEIALFPIPGSVSLPYSTVPLHIFEPRYRKMIKDSIADHRRIGVSHTKKMVSGKKTNPNININEILNSNLESYESYSIFSAGFAELLETLPDGRMIVQIKMDSRYEVLSTTQEVPYKIVMCREYLDREGLSENISALNAIRNSLDKIFINLASGKAEQNEMIKFLTSEEWLTMSHEEYSFMIYTLIIFEPETMQRVLELNSTFDRIDFLKDTLEHTNFRH